jgi:hypothetical protein
MSSYPDIVLHVGLPKTGSSAFQSFLYGQRKELNRQGWAYPCDPQSPAGPKQQALVFSLLRGECPKLGSLYGDIAHYRTIFSNEALTNNLYDFSADVLRAFRNSLSDCNLRLFIVLRNKKDWLSSYYAQSVLNRPNPLLDIDATEMTLAQFAGHPLIKRLLNFGQLIEDVENAFGARDSVVVDSEEDWLSVFSREFEINFKEGSSLPRRNISAPRWSTELMRQVNSFHLPDEQRVVWAAAVQNCVESQNATLLRAEKRAGRSKDASIDGTLLGKLRPATNSAFSLSAEHIDKFVNSLDKSAIGL